MSMQCLITENSGGDDEEEIGRGRERIKETKIKQRLQKCDPTLIPCVPEQTKYRTE